MTSLMNVAVFAPFTPAITQQSKTINRISGLATAIQMIHVFLATIHLRWTDLQIAVHIHEGNYEMNISITGELDHEFPISSVGGRSLARLMQNSRK